MHLRQLYIICVCVFWQINREPLIFKGRDAQEQASNVFFALDCNKILSISKDPIAFHVFPRAATHKLRNTGLDKALYVIFRTIPFCPTPELCGLMQAYIGT